MVETTLPSADPSVTQLEIGCLDHIKFPLRSFPGLKSIESFCYCDFSHFYDPVKGQALKDEYLKIWGASDLELSLVHG